MLIHSLMLEHEKFRESLIAHMERHGIGASELARKTGVPKTTLDKLVQRRVSRTNYFDAMRLARYFGKTLEEFVDGKPDDDNTKLKMLIESLYTDEKAIVEAQIEGIVARRGRKKP